MHNKHLIVKWEIWKELCAGWKINPYENVEYGEDRGGGDSFTWEFIGTMPKED